jgi:hypothetical protein
MCTYDAKAWGLSIVQGPFLLSRAKPLSSDRKLFHLCTVGSGCWEDFGGTILLGSESQCRFKCYMGPNRQISSAGPSSASALNWWGLTQITNVRGGGGGGVSDHGVGELLGSLGLGKYTGVFAREEVDLDALSCMTESDLQLLGIPMVRELAFSAFNSPHSQWDALCYSSGIASHTV